MIKKGPYYLKTVIITAIILLLFSLSGVSALADSYYKVNYGDTLYKIASWYKVPVNDIRKANNIWNDSIYAGQVLRIPDRNSSSGSASSWTYTVKSGDTLYKIAQRYGVSVNSIKSASNYWSDYVYVGQTLKIPSGGSGGSKAGGTGLFSQADISLLAKLARAEAEGEPYEGQVAVAASVLNRVKSPNYPNSIPGVIYQVEKGRYYQYSPVLDGRINKPPTSTSLKAANDAINGWDPVYGATGFYNPSKTGNWWVKSRTVVRVIGNHIFYK